METVYALCEPGKVVLKEKNLPKPVKSQVLLKAKYSAMSPGQKKD
jgi:L-iditol 2-dehydrogenase